LFPHDLFEEIVGDASQAEALKKDLHIQRLIATLSEEAASPMSSSVPCPMARGRSSSSFGTRRSSQKRWVTRS
jgi:hypothetical protein